MAIFWYILFGKKGRRRNRVLFLYIKCHTGRKFKARCSCNFMLVFFFKKKTSYDFISVTLEGCVLLYHFLLSINFENFTC